MNGIEVICGKIISDAKNKADEIIDKARKEAALFEEQQQVLTDSALESVKAEGKIKANEAKELKIKRANMDAKKMIASKKQSLISSAFTSALTHLASLPSEDYFSLLTELAKGACSQCGEGKLVFNASDREKYGNRVVDAVNAAFSSDKYSLSDEIADIRGGLILKSGYIDINCSLEVIINSLSDEMALEIADTLFAEGE